MLIVFIILLNSFLPLFSLPVFGNLVKNIYLIISCFHVVLCALLDLECDITIILEILGEPYCGEMSPTKLLNDNIPIKKDLTYMNWMITTNFVIRHTFILTGVIIFVEAFSKNISKWLEICVVGI